MANNPQEPKKDKFEQQRRQKLGDIRGLGIDPYGGRFEGVESADSAKGRFCDDDPKQQAKCAGRIVLLRDILIQGKTFVNIKVMWSLQSSIKQKANFDQMHIHDGFFHYYATLFLPVSNLSCNINYAYTNPLVDMIENHSPIN